MDTMAATFLLPDWVEPSASCCASWLSRIPDVVHRPVGINTACVLLIAAPVHIHFMSSYTISFNTNPHGVGYELVPKARTGSFVLPQKGHRDDIPADTSLDRVLLYLSMDRVAEDDNTMHRIGQYRVCEHRSSGRNSKNNKLVSTVAPRSEMYWKMRRLSKSSGGRGLVQSQASRNGCTVYRLVYLSPSSKLRPPSSPRESACCNQPMFEFYVFMAWAWANGVNAGLPYEAVTSTSAIRT